MSRPLLFSTALCAAALAVCATAHPAQASSTPASFVVVHGIPGRAVGETVDPALPVDVLVDGKYCLLEGLTYGSIAGPFDVPAGTYSIVVSQANPIAPCSNAAVISTNVTLTSGEFGAVVAAVSTAGAATAEVYPIDVTSVPSGEQRFITAHAADAPEVKVTLTSLGAGGGASSFKLAPGAENEANVASHDRWKLEASAGSTKLGPVKVDVGAQGLVLTVAVGVAADGSATLLTKVIPSVF
jgi:hypothetical protein